MTHSYIHHEGLESFEVKYTEPCDRVPSRGGSEALGATCGVLTSSAVVTPGYNIPDEGPVVSVQNWVDPTYRRPASLETGRIHKRNHASHHRG